MTPIDTGVKDKNGVMLKLGDRVRYNLQGDHTKAEYWNPEYEIVWDPPAFRLKWVGGGLDGGGSDFKLKHGGANGALELIKAAQVPEVNVFFVLNGLVNGEEGVKALTAGGPGTQMADGWYFLQGEDPDGEGPWRTRDEAVRRAEAEAGLMKLDVGDVRRAFLAGHLSPMTDGIRQGYADAPAICFCGDVGEFFVTVGWDPEDADWRCEAYIGDAAALVDLHEGTWERI